MMSGGVDKFLNIGGGGGGGGGGSAAAAPGECVIDSRKIFIL
jgi:hypothetical protein